MTIVDQLLNCLMVVLKIVKFSIPIAVVILLWIILKPYICKHDTVILFDGGLGSGKSLLSACEADKMYKVNTNKVKIHNLLHKKDKQPLPLLYSNIPIARHGRIISHSLSAEILIGRERIPPKSVVFIDEVALFCNQWESQKTNPELVNLEEFITLFRHYTHGGYLIINTQSVHKVNHNIRYCLDSAFHCVKFHRIPVINLAWIQVRHVDITEDVVNTNDGNVEDATRNVFMLLPRKKYRSYDTYAYSDLYHPVFDDEQTLHTRLKADKILKIGDTKKETPKPQLLSRR